VSARDALPDPAAPHPGEIKLIAPAGTVVVFNSHVWHGGTLNRTDRPRRALHGYFTRRTNGQQTDQKKHLSQETLARLSPAARFILDA
jgi:ectoine hydroxylase-related dioxygenase (phytanoyl-CoA dioxygenase family)